MSLQISNFSWMIPMLRSLVYEFPAIIIVGTISTIIGVLRAKHKGSTHIKRMTYINVTFWLCAWILSASYIFNSLFLYTVIMVISMVFITVSFEHVDPD